MEGIPDKHNHHNHHHHTVDDHQLPVGRYARTIYYDCIEVGKDVSRGVSDLYKGMVVFSGGRNERDIQEYSSRNDNSRNNKAVVSTKRDTSQRGDKNTMCHDVSITSFTKGKVSVFNYYTVIKAAHGVRFQSCMTSPRIFAKGLLNKRTSIGLKPGNRLISNAKKYELKCANDDEMLHEACSKEGQSVELGKENSGRLPMKRFYQRCNSNCLPLKTNKKTIPPNTNYNKTKSNNTDSSNTADRRTQNEILTCRASMGNYINLIENNTFTYIDAPRLRKQKLQQHMKKNSTCNENMGQDKNGREQIKSGQMSNKNILRNNYYQLGTLKNYPEGQPAIFDNSDNTRSGTTKNSAMMYGESENCGLSRQAYIKQAVDNNRNSRQKFAATSNRPIYSGLGIASLMSLDVKSKASKSAASLASSRFNEKPVTADWRLSLLITWNLLQLVFLVVIFLWASLCRCNFKKYLSEPRKCVRFEVKKMYPRK